MPQCKTCHCPLPSRVVEKALPVETGFCCPDCKLTYELFAAYKTHPGPTTQTAASIKLLGESIE